MKLAPPKRRPPRVGTVVPLGMFRGGRGRRWQSVRSAGASPCWGRVGSIDPGAPAVFAGVMTGSPLMHRSVNQKASFYGGYRVGFDYDFYWGLEGRLGASSICLSEPARIGQPGTNDYWNLDLNLHYYPWGDSRWRPFASFGIGMANFCLLRSIQQPL